MLTKWEQETIINFNKEENTASIFTYEKTWQQHLEKKLGLKPTLTNSKGGRGYVIDKTRIKMPRMPRLLTTKRKKQLREQLSNARLTQKSL